jgi:hypothetical protein
MVLTSARRRWRSGTRSAWPTTRDLRHFPLGTRCARLRSDGPVACGSRTTWMQPRPQGCREGTLLKGDSVMHPEIVYLVNAAHREDLLREAASARRSRDLLSGLRASAPEAEAVAVPIPRGPAAVPPSVAELPQQRQEPTGPPTTSPRHPRHRHVATAARHTTGRHALGVPGRRRVSRATPANTSGTAIASSPPRHRGLVGHHRSGRHRAGL